MKKRHLLFMILFHILLAGCSLGQEDNFAIPEGISDVNQSLRLTLVEETFNVRTGTTIFVENVSDYSLIYFDAYTDVRLFVLQGKEWQPVENNVIYHPSGDTFLPPSTTQTPFPLSFSIYPILPGLDTKTKLRALVIATVMENDQPTDKKVAAYVDLWVEP